MSENGGIEKRQDARAEVEMPVEYSFNQDQWYKGVGKDISRSGIFLGAKVLSPAGSKIYLKFHLPDSPTEDPLRVIGKVMRLVKSPVEQVGMGIRFDIILSSHEEDIKDFVRRIISPDPRLAEKVSGSNSQGFMLQFDAEVEKFLEEAEKTELIPDATSFSAATGEALNVKPAKIYRSHDQGSDRTIKWFYALSLLVMLGFIAYLLLMLIDFLHHMQGP